MARNDDAKRQQHDLTLISPPKPSRGADGWPAKPYGLATIDDL